jgi:hypothetical protein
MREFAIVASPDEAGDLGWVIRRDRQTWCPRCAVDAWTPKRRPNARGVVSRRRR